MSGCCDHPVCDKPAEQCDGDHFPIAWADGGETNLDNGRLRCPTHHPGRRRKRQPKPSPPPDADDGTDAQPDVDDEGGDPANA